MKANILLLLASAYFNAYILEELPAAISDSGIYIYGTVTTLDDEVYTGQIRWGKEEAFWFDHFNSSKPENDNLQFLSRTELRDLEEKDQNCCNNGSWFNNNSWNWSSNNDNTHVFACQFGDIKSIEPRRGERLILELRNGEKIKLEGGSNDVGALVRIHDEELGTIKLEWESIALVEFSSAPAGMKSAFGEPLYGTVETTAGKFLGYLQWDHDERLSDDELNGDTRNGELDIPFGNIKNIEKSYKGSTVELKSGRSFELTGSNDVNKDNRGIIVNILDMGRVDIPWEEFIRIDFEQLPSVNATSYNSYAIAQPLRGTIESTSGDQLTGRMIYDLDENYDMELLNGIHEDIEYFIPFRYVDSIRPKNRAKSLVKLRNGDTLLLEGKVDINEENDGVLVFSSEQEYNYVPWKDVEEITITDR